MKEPVLVVMAAGMGSRYGGLKQIDPVDQEGHIIMDFSIYDAVRAGFKKVIFIIKKENEQDFRDAIGDRLSDKVEIVYVHQDLNNIPEGFQVPEGRVKPWGTGHAVLSCAEVIDGPFVVINADDYYGTHAFKMAYDFLAQAQEDTVPAQYMMVGYRLENTLTDNGYVSRKAFDAQKKKLDEWTVFSVGGGALAEEGHDRTATNDIYNMNTMSQILYWCEHTGRSYWEYVEQCEGPEIWDFLAEVWETMKAAIHRGLDAEGVLPGPLNLRRKASAYYIRSKGYKDSLRSRGLVFAYALAVSEENASGGKIVTAPTCGACGVVPAVLYHLQKSRDFSDARILRALATAGLVGNIVKHNASISGAEAGCQAEVGVACSMASAAASQLFGGSPAQIEYAAEMGLEHHLGMTCDPVCGLVQIPCIERNAYAAARALDANIYSAFTDGHHRVSFDKVVEVMKQTGHDLPSLYKETSEGGLAKNYQPME